MSRKWTIKFIQKGVPNMGILAEIHANFAEEDQRIPSFSCYISSSYIQGENRPYQETKLLEFRLADVVDRSGYDRGFWMSIRRSQGKSV
jgi:hypothetical protein